MDVETIELMRVSKAEYEQIKARAQERGYESVADYVRDLIQQDEEALHAVDDEEDEDDIDPVEAFREGWRDAMQGNYKSVDDIRRRAAEAREEIDE